MQAMADTKMCARCCVRPRRSGDSYCRSCRNTYAREYMRVRNGSFVGSCAWCAGEFAGRRRRYCSSACSAAANRWNLFCRYEAAGPRPCAVCGDEFEGQGRRRTCSASCNGRLELLGRYGLTPSSFADLLAAQSGRCAACGGEFGVKGPQIDHCHENGHVRGVLCGNCNLALGHVKDDQERCFAMAAYLARDQVDLRELCVS